MVCVPNRDRNTVPEFPIDLPSLAGLLFTVALVLVGIVRLARRWRSRDRAVSPAPKGKRAREGWMGLGQVMNSPGVGTGDLGWGNFKTGAMLPRSRLNLHVLIAGATGSGKSTTVDRMELEAVRSYRPQVIHFDCKGRRDGAARFLALMLGSGYDDHQVRIAPAEPYDGWRGDERAHLNRLMAVQDFSDRQPYYTAATKDLLQQSLVGGRLPRLAGELVDRLARAPRGIDINVATGALARYRGFFSSLGGLLDGSWGFEDVEACYVELPGMARRDDALAFGRYLLEDFMHYIAERKDPERDVLLVLDDFSTISSGDEAVNLVERAREFNVGVVLTTQSYAGLGLGADRIIDAANGALIVHRMGNPEPFITRAGTVWRQVKSVTEPARQPGVISAVIFNTKPEIPRHTTRDQEFARIDANEVRSLPPGDAFVIADGRAQRIRVDPVAALEWRVDMPCVGEESLIDIARGNINMRKEMGADMHEGVVATAAPPPDPDLDF